MLQLTEGEMHYALNESSNSIAIIVKHLSGNMISRWTDFLTTDGEKPDRNRDQEFIDNLSKEEMLLNWEKGWNVLFPALGELTEEDLLKNVYIRGESHSVIDAIGKSVSPPLLYSDKALGDRHLFHGASFRESRVVYDCKGLRFKFCRTIFASL